MTEHLKAPEEFVENGTMKDIPGFSEEKQTIVDEDAINESFDPANNALDGLREGGEWLFDMIADFFTQLFGSLG